jgi:putative transcriptional regulator
MTAMGSPAELTAPVLLLAMPQILDPSFHRSVVLLVHHDEEGSVGFIVNRPTGIKVADILTGMEIAWHGDEAAVAHFGGPVQPQLGSVLWAPELDSGPVSETATLVVPGLAITQHVGDLAHLAGAPPVAFRLFLGYAGWGAGQLVDEILRNDWLTAPVAIDLLFAADRGGAWESALRSVGVDPALLPAWTSAGGEEQAN